MSCGYIHQQQKYRDILRLLSFATCLQLQSICHLCLSCIRLCALIVSVLLCPLCTSQDHLLCTISGRKLHTKHSFFSVKYLLTDLLETPCSSANISSPGLYSVLSSSFRNLYFNVAHSIFVLIEVLQLTWVFPKAFSVSFML